jgi:hypothetical protein
MFRARHFPVSLGPWACVRPYLHRSITLSRTRECRTSSNAMCDVRTTRLQGMRSPKEHVEEIAASTRFCSFGCAKHHIDKTFAVSTRSISNQLQPSLNTHFITFNS